MFNFAHIECNGGCNKCKFGHETVLSAYVFGAKGGLEVFQGPPIHEKVDFRPFGAEKMKNWESRMTSSDPLSPLKCKIPLNLNFFWTIPLRDEGFLFTLQLQFGFLYDFFRLIFFTIFNQDWKRSIRHAGKSMKLLLTKGILSTHPPICDCEGCRMSSPVVSSFLVLIILLCIIWGDSKILTL